MLQPHAKTRANNVDDGASMQEYSNSEHESPIANESQTSNSVLRMQRSSLLPQRGRTPGHILQLQRTIGNRAVTRLIEGVRQKQAGGVQRVILSPQDIPKVQNANLGELDQLYGSAKGDINKLEQEIAQIKQLLDFQCLQEQVINSITNQNDRMFLRNMGEERTKLETEIVKIEQEADNVVQQELVKAQQSGATPSQQEISAARDNLLGRSQPYLTLRQHLTDLQNRQQVALNLIQAKLIQIQQANPRLNLPQTILEIDQNLEKRPVQVVQARYNELQDYLKEHAKSRDFIGNLYTSKALKISGEVINETWGYLHKGAGNQFQDVASSNGLSQELTTLGRQIKREPVAAPFDIAQESIIAKILHAGNCGEHAAVAFCLLWQRLPGLKLTYYAHSMDHAFVVIGEPTEPDRAVVCDAWPRKAIAVTLSQFFVKNGLTDLKNVRFIGIADGSDLETVARPTVDYREAESRMDEERTPLTGAEAMAQYGNQLGHGLYQHELTHN